MTDVAAELFHLAVDFQGHLGVASLDVRVYTLVYSPLKHFLNASNQVDLLVSSHNREDALWLKDWKP